MVFVAIRDIRFAKGRFLLMGSVVALITVLVVLLSGLTSGLADESTSGVRNLPASHLAFGAGGGQQPERSFTDSTVTRRQLEVWSGSTGVRWAAPLGVTQLRLRTDGGATVPVTVFGVRPADPIAPDGVADGGLVVGGSVATDEGLDVGDRVAAGTTELGVSEVGVDASYSHTPVVWTSLNTWRELGATRGQVPQAAVGTVIAAELSGSADTDVIDVKAGTRSATTSESLSAIGSFSAENGSLLMMQGFLYVIAALVIGAFLTVWTIQRTGDIAILRALGGSTGYLLRDALGQALLVSTAGAVAGGAVGAGVGVVAAGAVPFGLTVATTVVPVVAMITLGMAGAALAVWRTTSVDPLIALGAVR